MSYLCTIVHNFPATLRACRRAKKLTIAQAAKRLGVSARTWAYWEAGERFLPKEKTVLTEERLIAWLQPPLEAESGPLILE